MFRLRMVLVGVGLTAPLVVTTAAEAARYWG
jgi:hypothetical protein